MITCKRCGEPIPSPAVCTYSPAPDLPDVSLHYDCLPKRVKWAFEEGHANTACQSDELCVCDKAKEATDEPLRL